MPTPSDTALFLIFVAVVTAGGARVGDLALGPSGGLLGAAIAALAAWLVDAHAGAGRRG